MRPTHETVAGRTYLALRKKARAEGRTTDELLQLGVLEACIDRLSTSSRRADLVLKGGVLLSAYDLRRPTRDVDLSAHNVSGEPKYLQAVIEDIANAARDDGWTFGTARSEVIREADTCSGVRVTLSGTLASARQEFHVDVSLGDVVWPAARSVTIARQLGGGIILQGYPLSMVFAEKLVTALQRGIANTRWRDFADVYLLARAHQVDAPELTESLRRVGIARGAALGRLSVALEGYAERAQTKWAAWVRKQRLVARLPLDFSELLGEVFAFADEPLQRAAAQGGGALR